MSTEELGPSRQLGHQVHQGMVDVGGEGHWDGDGLDEDRDDEDHPDQDEDHLAHYEP